MLVEWKRNVPSYVLKNSCSLQTGNTLREVVKVISKSREKFPLAILPMYFYFPENFLQIRMHLFLIFTRTLKSLYILLQMVFYTWSLALKHIPAPKGSGVKHTVYKLTANTVTTSKPPHPQAHVFQDPFHELFRSGQF